MAIDGRTSLSDERTAILVVDNATHHRVYVSMLLQRFRYRVVEAATADEAMERIRTIRPSLVVAELELPRMSGLDLLCRLRENGRTATLPVIAMTSVSDRETETRCLRAGFCACLQKPVIAEELYRAIQAAIEPSPRSSIRVQTRLSVMVNNAPLDCVEGECASVISEHGMYVRTLKPHPPNSRLAVQFGLKGRMINADAVVLYSHQSGEGPFGEPGMGLKFSRIAPQDREYLRTFILNEVTA